MTISKDDILFESSTDERGFGKGKYSYFGNGMITNFRQYADGYILSANVLFNYFKNLKVTDIDKLDLIVYPMCFIYRQIIELYLKHYYFSYSGKPENDLKQFIKAVKHDLKESWLKTYPILKSLADKAGFIFSFDAIESYVNQLNIFDPDSFKMRYPYTMSLKSTHDDVLLLDVCKLHQRMSELIEVLETIDHKLYYVIVNNEVSNINFETTLFSQFEECRQGISLVIDLLDFKCKEPPCEEDNMIEESFIDLSSITDLPEYSKERNELINKLSLQELQMIEYFYYAGREFHHYILAKALEERKKDVIYILYNIFQDSNLTITRENKHFHSVLSTNSYGVLLQNIKKVFSELVTILNG